jgi:hypothetical protein
LPSFSSIFQKKQGLTRSSGAELKGGGCAAAIKDRVTGAESLACAAQSDPAKTLVFMHLFLPPRHYCDAVWPD